MELIHTPLNLQQGFIHTGKSNVTNTVCAIYDRNKNTVITRPEYRDEKHTIMEFVSKNIMENFTLIEDDHFRVDSWQDKLYPKKKLVMKPGTYGFSSQRVVHLSYADAKYHESVPCSERVDNFMIKLATIMKNYDLDSLELDIEHEPAG